jgi:N-acetylglucosamine-6-phosphate deacetylase
MATETPARAMGWKEKGRLATGCDGDLVELSPQLEVIHVLHNSRRAAI